MCARPIVCYTALFRLRCCGCVVTNRAYWLNLFCALLYNGCVTKLFTYSELTSSMLSLSLSVFSLLLRVFSSPPNYCHPIYMNPAVVWPRGIRCKNEAQSSLISKITHRTQKNHKEESSKFSGETSPHGINDIFNKITSLLSLFLLYYFTKSPKQMEKRQFS